MAVNVLPVIESACVMARSSTLRSRSFSRAASAASGRTTQLDGGEPKPPRVLRVFSQQDRLIAIAEAVVPRTYQPIVVFEAPA